MTGDPKRDIPPVIDDPACAELAARFMAGALTGDARTTRPRYDFDGIRDYMARDGRRTRSKKHHGYGVTRKNAGRSQS